MQIVSCYVNLAGDLRHVVYKDRVTVAEVLVLRGLHGADAVNKIRPVGGARRHMIGNVAEKDRLIEIYGQKHDGPGRKLIEQLFPGFAPTMPATLKDIGVSEFDDDDSPTAVGASAAMSPAGAGGSPEPWQVPDAQPAATTSQSAVPSAGDEPGGDPPDGDLQQIEEEDDPGIPLRNAADIPGLRVT